MRSYSSSPTLHFLDSAPVVMTWNGIVKLCDFGLAIYLPEERPVSRAGTLVREQSSLMLRNRPLCMRSPEQATVHAHLVSAASCCIVLVWLERSLLNGMSQEFMAPEILNIVEKARHRYRL